VIFVRRLGLLGLGSLLLLPLSFLTFEARISSLARPRLLVGLYSAEF
jgi:hypothetical protein